MYQKIKTSYGINTMTIGNVHVCTIKLKLDRSFPVDKLPKAVSWIEVETISKKTMKSKFMWLVEYSAIECKTSKKVTVQIGDLLKEHAQSKLEEKYGWVDSLRSRLES